MDVILKKADEYIFDDFYDKVTGLNHTIVSTEYVFFFLVLVEKHADLDVVSVDGFTTGNGCMRIY